MIWRHCPECGSWLRKTEENCPECGCLLEREAGAEWIGKVIPFGTYPQGPNGEVKPIEWQILEVRDGKALLLSKYGLDAKPYNEEWTEITWEICTLRGWLNGEFLNSAFTEKEWKQIVMTDVPADKNPEYSTDPGNVTEDKVFLLSIPEAEKYFTSDNDRMCVPTAYAKAQGCYPNSNYQKDGQATCVWWLRSSGYLQDSAAGVLADGDIYVFGTGVLNGVDAVRPVLWVKLDACLYASRSGL